MKKLLAVLTLLMSTSVFAAPMTIVDGYIGADAHTHGDVIGYISVFNISRMDVSITGSTLTVQINTDFGAGNGLGSFASSTRTALSGWTGSGNGNGIGFGDLFLSSNGWNPVGPAPYLNDDHSNGTQWDYGISLDDRWDPTTGVALGATLYSLTGTNADNAHMSDDFLSGATYRNGQEVAVDTRSNTTEALDNDVSFGAYGDHILFSVDISGTGLENADMIGLHWGMTCANDVIEGEYDVPEPAGLALMALGLLGISGASRFRKKS